MVTLPIMLLAQQVDWTDPHRLFLGRVGFATAQIIVTLLCMYILKVWADLCCKPHALAFASFLSNFGPSMLQLGLYPCLPWTYSAHCYNLSII